MALITPSEWTRRSDYPNLLGFDWSDYHESARYRDEDDIGFKDPGFTTRGRAFHVDADGTVLEIRRDKKSENLDRHQCTISIPKKQVQAGTGVTVVDAWEVTGQATRRGPLTSNRQGDVYLIGQDRYLQMRTFVIDPDNKAGFCCVLYQFSLCLMTYKEHAYGSTLQPGLHTGFEWTTKVTFKNGDGLPQDLSTYKHYPDATLPCFYVTIGRTFYKCTLSVTRHETTDEPFCAGDPFYDLIELQVDSTQLFNEEIKTVEFHGPERPFDFLVLNYGQADRKGMFVLALDKMEASEEDEQALFLDDCTTCCFSNSIPGCPKLLAVCSPSKGQHSIFQLYEILDLPRRFKLMTHVYKYEERGKEIQHMFWQHPTKEEMKKEGEKSARLWVRYAGSSEVFKILEAPLC